MVTSHVRLKGTWSKVWAVSISFKYHVHLVDVYLTTSRNLFGLATGVAIAR